MSTVRLTTAGGICLIGALLLLGIYGPRPSALATRSLNATDATTRPAGDVQQDAPVCDQTLWAHLYHGRFERAQDRLRILQPCVMVTGTLINARREKDGDWHIRMSVDEPYEAMLNTVNRSRQHGFLVVETVCANRVTQTDTLEEGVCGDFAQDLFNVGLIGRHVQVIGVFVRDMEHGWNEIHPVTAISVQDPVPSR